MRKKKGVLLFIHPRLQWGFDHPFEIQDAYNGPLRGTWYFRSKVDGEVHGPFMDVQTASFAMVAEIFDFTDKE